jgi:hypothetical protein
VIDAIERDKCVEEAIIRILENYVDMILNIKSNCKIFLWAAGVY